jgi:hypothetical protein
MSARSSEVRFVALRPARIVTPGLKVTSVWSIPPIFSTVSWIASSSVDYAELIPYLSGPLD